MNDKSPYLERYISILDRQMRMYYDRALSGFKIGWGQQFFIEYIFDHPGASAQEIVSLIRVDKATITKVIKKLAKIGYVEVTPSDSDRRVKRLYLTGEAVPAAKRIKEIHRNFFRDLCAGIDPADIDTTESVMKAMTENIMRALSESITK